MSAPSSSAGSSGFRIECAAARLMRRVVGNAATRKAASVARDWRLSHFCGVDRFVPSKRIGGADFGMDVNMGT